VATIRDFFEREAQSEFWVGNRFVFSHGGSQQTIEVPARLVANFDANAKYLALFVPRVSDPGGFVAGLCAHLDPILKRLDEGPTATVGKHGEAPGHKADLAFAGRVFVYAEDELPDDTLQAIAEQLRGRGLHLRFRGPEYARTQTAHERPLAFSSYASSDREAIAEPLALALNSGQCPVWFDQYAMRVGDRLEGTLLKGIDDCLRCIVILSERYLANQRWARWEFERIAEREKREVYSLIIPVRCGVTDRQVQEFSPILADRRAIDWDPDPEAVRRIASDLSLTLLAVGRERERAAVVSTRRMPAGSRSLVSRLAQMLGRLRR